MIIPFPFRAAACFALSTLIFPGILTIPAGAGEKVLVIGDSLTKEYRSEFPALYPGNPDAWAARNWIEVLDARRNGEFDLGSWQVYSDWRLTGHEFNWAAPGGTSRDFRNFLRISNSNVTTDPGHGELLAASSLFTLSNITAWRNSFTGLLPQTDKVVIFFGGNDLASGNSDPEANPLFNGVLRQVDYRTIYEGTFGDASNPDLLESSIRRNVQSVMQWFRVPRMVSGVPVVRFTGPMILCAVPHVGATPKIQSEVGTDPVRTAVLTQMIERLNGDLRSIAAGLDIGFADTYAVTKAILDPGAFTIGGVNFIKQADQDSRTRYLFSGDGFHPNTAVHAKVSQVVADAFLQKYPTMAPSLQRLGDREIITDILGLPGDIGYVEYMTEAGVPVAQRGPLSDPDNDGIPNAVEYALTDRDAAGADADPPFTAVREADPMGGGEVLTVTWHPRFEENAYCDLIPQTSSDLQTWSPVQAPSVLALPNGRRQVRLAVLPGSSLYFRLAAVRPL